MTKLCSLLGPFRQAVQWDSQVVLLYTCSGFWGQRVSAKLGQ
jgi:hypothetical protein